jgi:putative hydrolase
VSDWLNFEIAARLDEVADCLAARAAPARRVALYRRGAAAVRELRRPVAAILHAEGLQGLIRVPRVGERLARAVRRLAVTGRFPLLERLRGAAATTTAAS